MNIARDVYDTAKSFLPQDKLVKLDNIRVLDDLREYLLGVIRVKKAVDRELLADHLYGHVLRYYLGGSLASIDRLGAVQTHFGRVAVEITGLIEAPYEVGSGYEAALKIVSSAPKTPKEALTTYKAYIREIGKATPYAKYCISSGIAETVRREADLKDIVKEAWSDAKAKHDELAKLAGGEGKKKGKK